MLQSLWNEERWHNFAAPRLGHLHGLVGGPVSICFLFLSVKLIYIFAFVLTAVHSLDIALLLNISDGLAGSLLATPYQ